MPAPHHFERGGIVGLADLYAVATASASPWFIGPVGFCLRDAKPLPFVPLLGRLGFFEAEYPGVSA